MEPPKVTLKNLKFFVSFDSLLFRFSQRIRKSNVTIVIAVLMFLLIQLCIYSLLFLQSTVAPLGGGWIIWGPDVAIPFIFTNTGLFFTIIVLFTIIPKGTQTGDQFIIYLIEEIDSLRNGDDITIISPNLNIGTTTYKVHLDSFIRSIRKAKDRGVKIYFLSKSLDEAYLTKFDVNHEMKDYINFFVDGQKPANKSEMLLFLYNLYNSHDTTREEYEKTVSDLTSLLKCVTIVQPKTNILTNNIVGFLSSNRLCIGKYYPDNKNARHVTLKGEIIDTPETVQLLRKYFIKDL